MNIHEHQAKELLHQFGIPTPDGKVAFSVREAGEATQQLPGPLFVVKAQIHAGGRGKGKFKEASAGEKGGVRLAKSRAEKAGKPNGVGSPNCRSSSLAWYSWIFMLVATPVDRPLLSCRDDKKPGVAPAR